MSVLDGLYYEFHIPLGLKELIEDLYQREPHNPNSFDIILKPSQREWFSQPRRSYDDTVEVIQINFKLPLSISEISFETVRVPVHIEVWYQDRSNNWRQMLDRQRIAITLNVSLSSAVSWYKFHSHVYPIVAKAVQIRLKRIRDVTLGDNSYSVGLRDTLIRRNVYTRHDAIQVLEDEQDVLGNVITSYVRDWDAAKAIDNKPFTYWKSEPMPDPEAVCCLYVDTRNPDGTPQVVDRVYIDPIYTGQTLNLYYSNDDTVGTRKLSPIALVPDTDDNTEWKAGKGRWDISAFVGESDYKFSVSWGPLVSQPCWFGIEWLPDFDPTSAPPQNPTLFEVVPTNNSGSQWWPTLYYDGAAQSFVLEFTDGSTSQTFTAPMESPFVTGDPLRIVVGWKYSPDTVMISVVTKDGVEVVHTNFLPESLPQYVTLDGKVGFANFRGLFTSHVLKLEDYLTQSSVYQANPTAYVSPDPVIPDSTGTIPSTTLDDAIFAADWTVQQYGTGGAHDTHYQDKEWTPVWKDYISQKGKLFLPQHISMKYLKLEFTDLTEEPYPIYDSGIQVHYQIFPVAVTILALRKHDQRHWKDSVLTLNSEIALPGRAVNWLNPSTIIAATNTTHGQTVLPIQVIVGPGIVTGSLPNTVRSAITSRVEASNPYVFRRQVMDNTALAKHAYGTVMNNEVLQGTPTTAQEFWLEIYSSTGNVSSLGPYSTPPLPIQGKDWWVFPGQTLKIPASVMEGLTRSQTKTWKKKVGRIRFGTICVHRYDVRTVTRDAAIAYFAGVREVQVYSTSYVASEDPVVFDFTTYDPTQWVFNDIKKLDTGPITNARPQYTMNNPGFDTGLDSWVIDSGTWEWDSDPLLGHWHPGTVTATADGTIQNLISHDPVDVQEGWDFSAWVWVRWNDVVSTGGSGCQLNVVAYLDGEIVETVTLDEITYVDWTGNETNTTWTKITGSYTVPSGVDQVRIRLTVNDVITAGTVHFDGVNVYSTDDTTATIYKDLITTSTFARVKCEFQDSGLKKSDGMWAQMDPLDTNISHTALAFYTSTIPDVIPAGAWADTFHEWGDSDIAWGAPRAVVAIDVDPNRIYDNKRVLHFHRASGAEEAGVKVRQITNFVRLGLFRICAVWLKPYANDNVITVRLRRFSDGVYIYEEVISNPAVGYWYNFQTHLIEIPDSADQEYTVELVLTGDDEDELYLSDLWCEVAQVRYFVRLGGSDEFLHDVTELRYQDSAYVSCTTPVNEVSVQASIVGDRTFLYGMKLTPDYLK